MMFWKRTLTIGGIIAASIDEHPEEWAFGEGFPLPFVNKREGWSVMLSETWAGDDLSVEGVPLGARETGKLWRAIDRFRRDRRDEARASAVHRHLAIAAGSGTAETSETSAQCEASQSGSEAASPKGTPNTPAIAKGKAA